MQTGETRGAIKVRKAIADSHEILKCRRRDGKGNHTCHYEGAGVSPGRKNSGCLNEGFRLWMQSHANSSESKEPRRSGATGFRQEKTARLKTTHLKEKKMRKQHLRKHRFI